MIIKSQPVKNVRAYAHYMADAPAHDGSGQRVLLAQSTGVTVAGFVAAVEADLHKAGRDTKGVPAFAKLYSWRLDELDPDNPDDVAKAMEIAMSTSNEVSPGTKKLFVAQRDGESGCLHIHECESNYLDEPITYEARKLVETRPQGEANIYESVPSVAKVGAAVPTLNRNVFRLRQVGDDVYNQIMGSNNKELMEATRQGPTMPPKESVKALVDYYVSQQDIQAGGQAALVDAMASQGWELVERGKKKTPSWVATSPTGAQWKFRWSSLGQDYSREAIEARLIDPSGPKLLYPTRVRPTNVQPQNEQVVDDVPQVAPEVAKSIDTASLVADFNIDDIIAKDAARVGDALRAKGLDVDKYETAVPEPLSLGERWKYDASKDLRLSAEWEASLLRMRKLRPKDRSEAAERLNKRTDVTYEAPEAVVAPVVPEVIDDEPLEPLEDELSEFELAEIYNPDGHVARYDGWELDEAVEDFEDDELSQDEPDESFEDEDFSYSYEDDEFNRFALVEQEDVYEPEIEPETLDVGDIPGDYTLDVESDGKTMRATFAGASEWIEKRRRLRQIKADSIARQSNDVVMVDAVRLSRMQDRATLRAYEEDLRGWDEPMSAHPLTLDHVNKAMKHVVHRSQRAKQQQASHDLELGMNHSTHQGPNLPG